MIFILLESLYSAIRKFSAVVSKVTNIFAALFLGLLLTVTFTLMSDAPLTDLNFNLLFMCRLFLLTDVTVDYDRSLTNEVRFTN